MGVDIRCQNGWWQKCLGRYGGGNAFLNVEDGTEHEGPNTSNNKDLFLHLVTNSLFNLITFSFLSKKWSYFCRWNGVVCVLLFVGYQPFPLFLLPVTLRPSFPDFPLNGRQKGIWKWGPKKDANRCLTCPSHRHANYSEKFWLSGGRNSRDLLRWVRKGEVSSFATLPASWFSASHNDWHFLVAYIQTLDDGDEGLMI